MAPRLDSTSLSSLTMLCIETQNVYAAGYVSFVQSWSMAARSSCVYRPLKWDDNNNNEVDYGYRGLMIGDAPSPASFLLAFPHVLSSSHLDPAHGRAILCKARHLLAFFTLPHPQSSSQLCPIQPILVHTHPSSFPAVSPKAHLQCSRRTAAWQSRSSFRYPLLP